MMDPSEKRWEDEPFDLVVTYSTMPRFDGPGLIAEVRAPRSRRSI
jgi:hypothetical protein